MHAIIYDLLDIFKKCQTQIVYKINQESRLNLSLRIQLADKCITLAKHIYWNLFGISGQ